MINTTDYMITTMLVNVIFQKGRDPKLVVEQLDQSLEELFVLPGKRLFLFCASFLWRNIAKWHWIHTLTQKAQPVFSEKSGSRKMASPSFEVSRKRALDRANSWQISKQPGRPSKFIGHVPKPRQQQQVKPVEPMYVCGEYLVSGNDAADTAQEKSAATPAAPSEEHEEAGILAGRS